MALGKKTGGRTKGTPNKQSAELRKTLTELAREHTEAAVATLISVMKGSDSDSARISAANSLLDRGYGKPPQFNTGSADEFNKITEMSDDELERIARGGSDGAAEAPVNPPVTH